MKKWDEVIKKALKIYTNRDKYAYFYGAKGQVLSDAVMNQLISNEQKYFSKYNSTQIINIKNYSRGKIGYDCSGFTGACTGDMSYSGSQIDNCNVQTTPVAGTAGSLLYKPGHIGLDIGYGFFLHFPIEGRTCELAKISDYNWVKSGESNFVDYSGATNR